MNYVLKRRFHISGLTLYELCAAELKQMVCGKPAQQVMIVAVLIERLGGGQQIVAFLFSRRTREALLSKRKEGHT